MFPFTIELIAVLLFIGCVWHAQRYAGRAFAEQWFIAAYLYAIIRETINQVALQTYGYAPQVLYLGAAPALICLLWGSVFYLAYQFARRLSPTDNGLAMLGLLFVITASFALPLEATAVQLGWWNYAHVAHGVLGGLPLSVPIIWGGAAVIFYGVFSRVSRSALPERGRLYALVTLAPVIAVAHLLWALIVGGFLG